MSIDGIAISNIKRKVIAPNCGSKSRQSSIDMVDEKWQKVRESFDSALRCQPEERRRFVFAACRGDKVLLAEVESLLSSHDSDESFLETPAVAEVADVIETEGRQFLRPLIRFSLVEVAY